MGFYAIAGMGAVVVIALAVVWSALRASGRAAAAEANEAAHKRLVEAIEQEKKADAERIARMADAAAASVDEPASRIRDRMRKRPANTR